jgi:hypothetical protein
MNRMLHTCRICQTMLLLDDYYFYLELIGHIPYCKLLNDTTVNK